MEDDLYGVARFTESVQTAEIQRNHHEIKKRGAHFYENSIFDLMWQSFTSTLKQQQQTQQSVLSACLSGN